MRTVYQINRNGEMRMFIYLHNAVTDGTYRVNIAHIVIYGIGTYKGNPCTFVDLSTRANEDESPYYVTESLEDIDKKIVDLGNRII